MDTLSNHQFVKEDQIILIRAAPTRDLTEKVSYLSVLAVARVHHRRHLQFHKESPSGGRRTLRADSPEPSAREGVHEILKWVSADTLDEYDMLKADMQIVRKIQSEYWCCLALM